MSTIAYIGLGSNLNEPIKQCHAALLGINAFPHTQILAHSKFYWNKFIGDDNAPECLNGVAKVLTHLSAETLLVHLLILEKQRGRERNKAYHDSRILDLDLLLYGDAIINTDKLIIPHPNMYQRHFVLFPLAEIEPNLLFPTKERLCDLLKTLSWEGRAVSITSN